MEIYSLAYRDNGSKKRIDVNTLFDNRYWTYQSPVEDWVGIYGYSSSGTPYPYYKHKGIDLHDEWYAPVYSISSGKVIDCYNGFAPSEKASGSLGNYVIIDYDKYQIRYGHFAEIANGIYVGKTVDKNTILGYQGDSGESSGTHVHIDIRDKNGGNYAFIDPYNIVQNGFENDNEEEEFMVTDNSSAWAAAGKPNKLAMWIGGNRKIKVNAPLLNRPSDNALTNDFGSSSVPLVAKRGTMGGGYAKINYLYASYACVEVYDQFGELHANAFVHFDNVIW